MVGLWWLHLRPKSCTPFIGPSPAFINFPKENPLALSPVGRKGPNYYPPGSNSSGAGEAEPQEPYNSKERSLKMLEQQSPCAHSSYLSLTPSHWRAVLQGLLCCSRWRRLLQIRLPTISLQMKERHSQVPNLLYQLSHNIVGCQFISSTYMHVHV